MKPKDIHHERNHHRKAGPHGKGRREPAPLAEVLEEFEPEWFEDDATEYELNQLAGEDEG